MPPPDNGVIRDRLAASTPVMAHARQSRSTEYCVSRWPVYPTRAGSTDSKMTRSAENPGSTSLMFLSDVTRSAAPLQHQRKREPDRR